MGYHDNVLSHSSVVTKVTRRKLGTETMKHPAYSPDLALCDLWPFPKLKPELRARRFGGVDDLPMEVSKIPHEHFRSCFGKWIRRCEKCVSSKGGPFRKTATFKCFRQILQIPYFLREYVVPLNVT